MGVRLDHDRFEMNRQWSYSLYFPHMIFSKKSATFLQIMLWAGTAGTLANLCGLNNSEGAVAWRHALRASHKAVQLI
jgi:hypothetical protein